MAHVTLDPHDLADAVNQLVQDNEDYLSANEQLQLRVDQVENNNVKLTYEVEELKLRLKRAEEERRNAVDAVMKQIRLRDATIAKGKLAMASLIQMYGPVSQKVAKSAARKLNAPIRRPSTRLVAKSLKIKKELSATPAFSPNPALSQQPLSDFQQVVIVD